MHHALTTWAPSQIQVPGGGFAGAHGPDFLIDCPGLSPGQLPLRRAGGTLAHAFFPGEHPSLGTRTSMMRRPGLLGQKVPSPLFWGPCPEPPVLKNVLKNDVYITFTNGGCINWASQRNRTSRMGVCTCVWRSDLL